MPKLRSLVYHLIRETIESLTEGRHIDVVLDIPFDIQPMCPQSKLGHVTDTVRFL